MRASVTPIRTLVIAAACLSGTAVVTAPAAAAKPLHTSCRDLGALIVTEAHAHTIADENRSLPPGSLDDLIHAVQVGGEFNGEPIPAFCQPK